MEEMEAREKKKDIQWFVEESYNVTAPFGYKPDMCKRQRKGKYFTDDDFPATKKLFEKQKEEKRLKELHACWDEAYEAKRWAVLREGWKKDEEEGKTRMHNLPTEDNPGIFHVSQDKNNGYDTYSDFVVIARSEADARATHPGVGTGDSFTYCNDELRRNEEWRDSGNPGPAPAWYLGDYNDWVHGAFVKVERISDYNPPPGQKPKYGIITSSYRAG